MLVTVVMLMQWNFKHAIIGWPVWRRNVLMIATSLLFAATATASIYHRAWELFLPLEPSHAVAHLPAGSAKLKTLNFGFAAELSDGRVWLVVPQVPGLRDGEFLEGTNWAQIEAGGQNLLGIQKDNSLWILAYTRPVMTFHSMKNQRWTRVGSGTDWKALAGNGPQALLLKTDGTLWRLGTNAFGTYRDLNTLSPERLGSESDWAELSVSGNHRVVLRRADGAVFVSPPVSQNGDAIDLASGFTMERTRYLDGYRTTAELLGPMGWFVVGIRDDGTFCLAAKWDWQLRNARNMSFKPRMIRVDEPLDSGTNWIAVAGNNERLVTLRSDGTLWKWTFPSFPNTNLTEATSTRLSKHSDWLAIAPAWGGVVSLAADGSVWLWPLESPRIESQHPPLLGISRRPRLVAEIPVVNQ